MANDPVPTPVQSQPAPRDWWFITKLVLCVLIPPLAVFLELHSFDRIPLIITGVSLILWIFGWIPGKPFCLFWGPADVNSDVCHQLLSENAVCNSVFSTFNYLFGILNRKS
eukprot:jgi/Botrbrau1/12817/Bobra.20_1s0008.1